MNNEEHLGMWLHKETMEIFVSLKVFPVVDPEFDRNYELRNESHMRLCNEKEFSEQFQKL